MKECRKSNLSSSRSECRLKANPLQEWVDIFEFQITWLAKLLGFLCSSIFPNSKDTRGPQMMDSFRSDLEICATHPQGGAQKKGEFFFYHTLLGSSSHVVIISPSWFRVLKIITFSCALSCGWVAHILKPDQNKSMICGN